MRAVVDQMTARGVVPFHEHGPRGARRLTANLREPSGVPSLGGVEDRLIPGATSRVGGSRDPVPVRIYRPAGEGVFPAVVYFHGGGFVLGGLDTHDDVCRHVCEATDAVVVAVDYRLAPEHRFPAAVEDAYAATEWVATHPDEVGSDGRLAVAGDSAGGTLAAVVSLLARDRDGPDLDYQALVYPAVEPGRDRPSWDENLGAGHLTAGDFDWFEDCYLGSDVHDANPYAFPMAAASHADLPPATVVTAGFDPLRDEGLAYAETLSDAGVAATGRNYDDVAHGFVGLLVKPRLDRAHEALSDVAGDLRAAFE